MALQLDTIRSTAERVATSHHLELVDLEFSGGAKFRTLRVFIEKDAEVRAKLVELAKAAEAGDPLGPPPNPFRSGPAAYPSKPSPASPMRIASSSPATSAPSSTSKTSSPAPITPSKSPPLASNASSRRPAEFVRFSGSLIKLQTFTAIAGNRHFQGRLTSFDSLRPTLSNWTPQPSKPRARQRRPQPLPLPAR